MNMYLLLINKGENDIMNKTEDKEFKFEMSLSVLNHLGRNLYRNFITVLGEAISNAWDADANNVNIYIDKEYKSMTIIDDGVGMTADDFQHKFLRVGHTKRSEGNVSFKYKRPYIGRKGIGKLALLSCSEKVHIATKYSDGIIVGGSIDNSNLDEKIAEGGELGEYTLDILSDEMASMLSIYSRGTAIRFENLKTSTINSLENVKKSLALYFQFAMLDKNFNIFVNDEKVTVDNLKELVNKTQMLWNINSIENELVDKIEALDGSILLYKTSIKSDLKELSGFIATGDTPSSLKVSGLEGGQATLDLFVNGRVREKDLLKHFPTKRIVESYVYGQIHYNTLDQGDDAFTSSREGIIVTDPRFQELIKEVERIFRRIMDDWDNVRVENRKKGDPEGTALDKKERPAREMVQAILEEDFGLAKSLKSKKKKNNNQQTSEKLTITNRDVVDKWIAESEIEAAYNAKSYATCFVAENLLRDYIKHKNMESQIEVDNHKKTENERKEAAGIDYEIRQKSEDIFYAGMDELVGAVATSNEKSTNSGIIIHGKKFKPLRNAVAHTALLTQEAKTDLELNFTNIKERLIKKLDEFQKEDTLIKDISD